MSNIEYIAFSAKLNGIDVRVTVDVEDLEIVTRDNTQSFKVTDHVQDLKEIEFEDMY